MSRPGLLLQIAKQADGSALLRCIRADDSTTWQKQRGDRAAFFPLHDLTHYAVETELGFRRGFFGLIAEGWEIAETTGQTARGPLPNETLEVEYLVSAFSAERAGSGPAAAEEFNQLSATFADSKGMPRPRQLTDEDLKRVRTRFDELSTKWRNLQPGKTLELPFA